MKTNMYMYIYTNFVCGNMYLLIYFILYVYKISMIFENVRVRFVIFLRGTFAFLFQIVALNSHAFFGGKWDDRESGGGEIPGAGWRFSFHRLLGGLCRECGMCVCVCRKISLAKMSNCLVHAKKEHTLYSVLLFKRRASRKMRLVGFSFRMIHSCA